LMILIVLRKSWFKGLAVGKAEI